MHATLTYRVFDGRIAAIRETLRYAEIDVETRVSTDRDVCLVLHDEVDDSITLGTWRSAFLAASRAAHTLPSHPGMLGVVYEAVEFVEGATLDELEAARLGATTPWICTEASESTAVDFLLIYKLRHMRAIGVDFAAFPNLGTYMDRDPACATETYNVINDVTMTSATCALF